MRKLKLISAWLLIVVLLCGCAKTNPPAQTPTDEQQNDNSQQQPQTPTGVKNPLTGEYSLTDETQLSLRPVAVSVNNQLTARKCQSGLNDADIIYETYVEGGLTRILALYKDISKVGEIGSIRSARYDFVDLCLGHDATYIHAGIDPTYCQPYIKEMNVDSANLLYGSLYSYAYRIENGLVFEHTLYSTGENLNKMLKDKGWRTTVKDDYKGDWQAFNNETKKLTGGTATSITAKFSGDFITTFKYDAQKDVYINGERKDWHTGNDVAVKNVVVLFTSLKMFGDGYRVKVGLTGGEGYYFSNGTYQKIKWTKGGAYDSMKFTDENGNPLNYNPGNSWVCMVSNDMRGAFKYE